jgi:crotonobetainyl-CoA:carnitine CoA-transferase CaiB-like acyl-CoA transferase
MVSHLLNGLRALDLSDERGYLCGQILASLGVDVIKIEKPGGDHGRKLPPFINNIPGSERSLYWNAYNFGKKSMELDLNKEGGINCFKKLAQSSDFVIETFEPGYLDSLGIGYENLRELNPGIIMTSITPFGQKGPFSSYKGSDLIVEAMGFTISQQGDPDRAPVRLSIPIGYLLASADAAEGMMIAYSYKNRTGIGQHVDCSAMEAIIWVGTSIHLGYYENYKKNPRRLGASTLLGGGLPTPTVWPCKDGYITFVILGGKVGSRTNTCLTEWMQEENAAIDLMNSRNWLEWDRAKASKQELDMLVDAIGGFFKSHTKAELQKGAFERDIQLYQVSEIPDLLNNEQLKSRRFWKKVVDKKTGIQLIYPGPFAKLSNNRLKILGSSSSPGQHNKEIMEMMKPKAVKGKKQKKLDTLPEEALSGMKVLSFVTAGVGPILARSLAAHGATVITVESSKYPDITRTIGLFKDNIPGINRSWVYSYTNPNKYCISIDLKNPKAEEIKNRLVSWADVIVDNFRPGVAKSWGLSYQEIHKINPRAVVLSSSQQGQTGPYYNFAAAGPHLVGYAGFTAMAGWPDRPPTAISPYPDHIVPRFANAALLAAVEHANRTGKGQFIDIAQFEVSVYMFTPAVLDYVVNKNINSRNGNRCAYAAPHGLYQCQGDDRWCAIAIFSEDEWKCFTQVTGIPGLSNDKRFTDLSLRKRNEDDLDKLIENWTSSKTPEQVMTILQNAGIEAGTVRNLDEIYLKCPQLDSRNYWWKVNHPEMGEITIMGGISYLLSKTPYHISRPSPCLGEHSIQVCSDILGMTDDEIIYLEQNGVLI